MAPNKQRSRRTRQGRASSSGGPKNGVTSRIFDALLVLSGGLAQERMAVGAEKVQAMAEATRDFGRSMPAFPEAKNYVDFAAKNLEGLATYISETDLAEMVEDAGVFAKRHPVAIMCVGIAGGLLATQLLRANVGGFATHRSTPRKRTRASNRPSQARTAKKAANGRVHADA